MALAHSGPFNVLQSCCLLQWRETPSQHAQATLRATHTCSVVLFRDSAHRFFRVSAPAMRHVDDLRHKRHNGAGSDGPAAQKKPNGKQQRSQLTLAGVVHLVLRPLPMDCKRTIGAFLTKPRYVKAAIGYWFVAFLRDDGLVDLAWRTDTPSHKKWRCPLPPPGQNYVNISASRDHLLLILSSGLAIMMCDSNHDLIAWRPSEADVKYIGGAASVPLRGVVVRDDGQADVYDTSAFYRLPGTSSGDRIVAAASFLDETVLLRGKTIVWPGSSWSGQGYRVTSLPEMLLPGVKYTSIGLGMGFVIALRNDGRVHLQGDEPQCQMLRSALQANGQYIEMAAGTDHVVLLRSDGQVEAVYKAPTRLCEDVPTLPEGMTYTHVCVQDFTTVIIRSDSEVFITGLMEYPGRMYYRPPALTGLRLLPGAMDKTV